MDIIKAVKSIFERLIQNVEAKKIFRKFIIEIDSIEAVFLVQCFGVELLLLESMSDPIAQVRVGK